MQLLKRGLKFPIMLTKITILITSYYQHSHHVTHVTSLFYLTTALVVCGWILASVPTSLSNTTFVRVDLYPLTLHLPRYSCEMMRSSAVVTQTVMLEADILFVQQISIMVRFIFRALNCAFSELAVRHISRYSALTVATAQT